MKKRILALCDLETEYAVRFAQFLDKKLLPFDIRIFTGIEPLLDLCAAQQVELILISESAYDNRIEGCGAEHVIILGESGEQEANGRLYVDKYQPSELILREVMCYYTGQEEKSLPKLEAAVHSKLIGVYSPVKRCLQTSFAIALGQIMARSSRVLYLNFEGYSGFDRLMHKDFTLELSDLLYYAKHAKGKLIYQLESMVENIGGLNYVPPVFSVRDLSFITGSEWLELLDQLCRESPYEYIILDLSDNLQGLFDILRRCERIYTIAGKDSMAQAKMEQYEQLLQVSEYEDILKKTQKCRLPQFCHMPLPMEQLPFSELAAYIRKSMGIRENENIL